MESPFFDWELSQGICWLFNIEKNKLNFADDYFSLKNKTISLLFMWILWNKSDRKYLHTLLNDCWECDLFLFMRIWCSNYRNMQYWLSSNHVLIIIPSYDVYHVHQRQSDGMDHQWFQNTILLHIKKMTFLYIIPHNIYCHHLNPWYILWYGYATTLIIQKKTCFPFILMLPDRNKMSLKYQLGCFSALH